MAEGIATQVPPTSALPATPATTPPSGHSPPHSPGSDSRAQPGTETQAVRLWTSRDAIRGEVFSRERLEVHAREIAADLGSRLRQASGNHRCWERFDDNSQSLRKAYSAFAEAVHQGEPIAPAGEWLLDNFYIIEEQLRDVRQHVPRSFYRELPKVANGPLAGYPQVYALALELIAHTDSSLDENILTGFATAYQSIAPLTMGELWAWPAMLRLVLIENLRRMSDQELVARREQAEANTWLQSEACTSSRRDDKTHAAALVRLQPYLDRPVFLIRVADYFREHGEEQARCAEALEQWLAEQGSSLADLVRTAQQRQASNQVSIGNAVTSMRLLSALDWNLFFERVSLIEKALRHDPAGLYACLDFATRDSYRHAVEEIAKHSPRSELDVARRAVGFAAEANTDLRRRHVGYWLIGRGRATVEEQVQYEPTLYLGLCRFCQANAGSLYFGAITAIVCVLSVLAASLSLRWAPDRPWLALLAGVAAAPLAAEAALAFVNFMAMALIRPKLLPKLEFKEEIPANCQTMVVIPTLLGSPEGVTQLLERLEVHYLANPERGMYFALLTDFTDADQETTEKDQRLIDLVCGGIERLNEQYPLDHETPYANSAAQDRFFVFHRKRQWNASEGRWMGWERKRGKLDEFNRLLRRDPHTSYTVTSGRLNEPEQIRFVITLDSDTQLPPSAARKLIGTLAHPLNQPRFHRRAQRVIDGYALLQPRVSVSLPSVSQSAFARIFAGRAGLDPYTMAVSDVYQDVFSEANFTGKGIYDVDAFAAATGRAFRENQILSHDLIEGCHARVALVSDIELFDDFPARYHAFARRAHRWVRGDWQISPWLFSQVPASNGWRPNPVTPLSQWKIFDNLRRSLVAPALVLWLALGWLVFPGYPWVWTLAALFVLGQPFMAQLSQTVRTILSTTKIEIWKQPLADVRVHVVRLFLNATFLAHQAVSMVDAVVRSLYRMLVSRRHMLEWETASSAERRLAPTLESFVREMWPSMALSAALLPFVPWAALPWALPWLVLWIAAPWIAYRISLPLAKPEPALTAEQRLTLRRLARRTWTYFENFVSAEDNWLPPDNFQEYPVPIGGAPGTTPGIAHRTSPTNEGLFLVSALAAQDLGYLSLHDFAALLEKNLDSCERLERQHGHFLNWYDTCNLSALHPRYISTVDSGNLAASFLTVREGLLDRLERPFASQRIRDGLLDTLELVHEALERVHPPGMRFVNAALTRLQETVKHCRTRLEPAPSQLSEWQLALSHLSGDVASMRADVAAFLEEIKPSNKELHFAVDRLVGLVLSLPRDLELLEADQPRPESPTAAALSLDDWRWAAGFEPLAERLRALAERLQTLVTEMDFSLTYDRRRKLFAIGYNLDDERLDNSHYDLLASEARLASFLAVGKGEVEAAHWFRLGRSLTQAGDRNVLLSWSGTMFEYLMPLLFQRRYAGTLLDEACQGAVDAQIDYARQKRIPWGISESAFAAVNISQDYHYQAFGAPKLGLKRGLGQDLVVAPYATALALMVRPHAALANFAELTKAGGQGSWGFYEALDYTPARVPKGQKVVPVRCFMSHHQGMSLTAMANVLNGEMLSRFARMPLVRASELLLQERPPVAPQIKRRPEAEAEIAGEGTVQDSARTVSRRLTRADSPAPRTHLLGNGRYTVMLTNAGTGFSRCEGVQMTRWRSDATLDPWGQFVLLRDPLTQGVWSATAQPLGKMPDDLEMIYAVDKAQFRRRDGQIETRLEVVVSPEHDVESRQLTLINHGQVTREIEVTSFAEIALADPSADLAHPAFHKLFVQTEALDPQSLLAMRRPRSSDHKPQWAIHVLALEGAPQGALEHETDRSKFLGRRRNISDPAALDRHAHLSNTTGAVLDPVFSLRCTVRLEPGQTRSIAFSTGYARSREEAEGLADQYRELRTVKRAFELAWAHSQVELRRLKLMPAEVHLFQRLAAGLLFVDPRRRGAPHMLAKNRLGRPGLWRFGVSGDHPILLVRLAESDHLALFREALRAHAYWRHRGFHVDLLALNEHAAGYVDELQEQLAAAVRASESGPLLDKPAGIFLIRGAHLSEEDRALLQTAANIVLDGRSGSLAQQVEPAGISPELPDLLETKALAVSDVASANQFEAPSELLFDNGIGGFDPATGDYVIRLRDGHGPRMPWSNVLANPRFGCLVSESGAGYSWCDNSRENKLTPWFNDPVSDSAGEALYLRDEATGEIWSPLPVWQREGSWTVRHAPGVSRFSHRSHGLTQESVVSIAANDPAKFVRLTLRNESGRDRELSATFYAEFVLGVQRHDTQLFVKTERGLDGRALFATNVANPDFGQKVAFLTVAAPSSSRLTMTGDRNEFFGRLGQRARPAALERFQLSGNTGAGFDPCGALQVKLQLPADSEVTLCFVLGQGDSHEEARQLADRFGEIDAIDAAWRQAESHWQNVLSAVQVHTPNQELDVIVNRWLLYQAASCRLFGRSGFYQSGGAFGFRDQLQDVMALVYAQPQLAREHILRAAARQFEQGDVQHWWHPPVGRGVRTKFSDDFLWLVYVTLHYLETTGDESVLAERLPFLHSALLEPHEEERYETPEVSRQADHLLGHCLRAIDHAMRFGSHGLPLIGTGDWNDGFNKIGVLGQGETVWGAWFLLDLLERFAPVVAKHGDAPRASYFREQAARLREAVETHAWDGAWYRRAFFDDGTPVGSAANAECQIDSLAQTWAVFAKGNAQRVRQAMEEVSQRLVREDEGLILLFTPPFDRSAQEPGYIKGYLPGVRENGGQYTHAALWVVRAFAQLGDGTRAMQLWDLLNPVRHTSRRQGVERYQVEPYVAAADVYGRPPHVGRGGWTWYTGSASWMYRVALESLLGFRLQGDRLRIEPCIPAAWDGYRITYRHGATTYEIEIDNSTHVQRGVREVLCDGVVQADGAIPLVDDGRRRQVTVRMGS